jgi:hypothetical protein
VSYFSLRKREPEPEDETAGEVQEAPTEDAQDTAKAAPTSWAGALWAGISGPSMWLTASTNIEASLIVHVFLAWAVVTGSGWIAAPIVTVWAYAVLAFIPREYKDRATTAIERFFTPAPKAPAAPAPGGEREAVRRLLLDLIGDAHGVHLNTVLAHLQEHGQWEGRTVTDMRARLAHLGIPHDRSVKVAGVPTWGVRRTALEAPSPTVETSPSPTPSPPV